MAMLDILEDTIRNVQQTLAVQNGLSQRGESLRSSHLPVPDRAHPPS